MAQYSQGLLQGGWSLQIERTRFRWDARLEVRPGAHGTSWSGGSSS